MTEYDFRFEGFGISPERALAILRHTLGITEALPDGYRNYYFTTYDDPEVEALVALGLLREGAAAPFRPVDPASRFYHATDKGRQFVNLMKPVPVVIEQEEYFCHQGGRQLFNVDGDVVARFAEPINSRHELALVVEAWGQAIMVGVDEGIAEVRYGLLNQLGLGALEKLINKDEG